MTNAVLIFSNLTIVNWTTITYDVFGTMESQPLNNFTNNGTPINLFPDIADVPTLYKTLVDGFSGSWPNGLPGGDITYRFIGLSVISLNVLPPVIVIDATK